MSEKPRDPARPYKEPDPYVPDHWPKLPEDLAEIARKNKISRRLRYLAFAVMAGAVVTLSKDSGVKERQAPIPAPSMPAEPADPPIVGDLMKARLRIAGETGQRPKVFRAEISDLERCTEVENIVNLHQSEFATVGVYMGKHANEISDPGLKKDILAAIQKNFNMTPQMINQVPEQARSRVLEKLQKQSADMKGCGWLVRKYFQWNREKFTGQMPTTAAILIDELIKQVRIKKDKAEKEEAQKAAESLLKIIETLR